MLIVLIALFPRTSLADRLIPSRSDRQPHHDCGKSNIQGFASGVKGENFQSENAALDLSRIVFKARGVRNGKSVERQARARYWKSRIKVTGDAEETPLFAPVADLPGLVFQIPERAVLGKLTVTGEGVEPAVIPAGVTRAEAASRSPAKSD